MIDCTTIYFFHSNILSNFNSSASFFDLMIWSLVPFLLKDYDFLTLNSFYRSLLCSFSPPFFNYYSAYLSRYSPL